MAQMCHCLRCMQNLYEYGEIAYGCYEHICKYYVANGFYLPIEVGKEPLGVLTLVKFLELKGYVVTHELGDVSLLVKPIGYLYLKKEGHFFCTKFKQHWTEKDVENYCDS